MLFKVDAHMESFGESNYVAWIDHPKNFKMVVQGETVEETAKELLTSLRVTLSYMLGIDINTIQEHQGFDSDEELERDLSSALKNTGKKELKFAFS